MGWFFSVFFLLLNCFYVVNGGTVTVECELDPIEGRKLFYCADVDVSLLKGGLKIETLFGWIKVNYNGKVIPQGYKSELYFNKGVDDLSTFTLVGVRMNENGTLMKVSGIKFDDSSISIGELNDDSKYLITLYFFSKDLVDKFNVLCVKDIFCEMPESGEFKDLKYQEEIRFDGFVNYLKGESYHGGILDMLKGYIDENLENDFFYGDFLESFMKENGFDEDLTICYDVFYFFFDKKYDFVSFFLNTPKEDIRRKGLSVVFEVNYVLTLNVRYSAEDDYLIRDNLGIDNLVIDKLVNSKPVRNKLVTDDKCGSNDCMFPDSMRIYYKRKEIGSVVEEIKKKLIINDLEREYNCEPKLLIGDRDLLTMKVSELEDGMTLQIVFSKYSEYVQSIYFEIKLLENDDVKPAAGYRDKLLSGVLKKEDFTTEGIRKFIVDSGLNIPDKMIEKLVSKKYKIKDGRHIRHKGRYVYDYVDIESNVRDDVELYVKLNKEFGLKNGFYVDSDSDGVSVGAVGGCCIRCCGGCCKCCRGCRRG